MDLINVKCPHCGEVFQTEYNATTTTCVKCNRDFETQKGSKFYKSFSNVEKQKSAFIKGENYLKVDTLLNEAEYYLKNEDFSKAEEILLSANALNDNDFRVHLNLVYVKTKNFQDISDETHIPHLKKAITLASDEEKANLKKVYSNYYKKSKLTKEEMDDYMAQENAHHYSSLEKLLKDGIPTHFNREKQCKTSKVVTILSGCLAIVFLTLTFALQIGILSIFGGVSLVAFIGVLFKHVSNSTKVKIYNMALDIFDAYNSFNVNVKNSVEILKTFKDFALDYLNNESDYVLNISFNKVIKLLLEEENDIITEFFKNHKILNSYV